MPKPIDLLSEYASRKRAMQGIDFTEQGDAVSRLQTLNLSGIDYQGQVSSASAYRGIEASASPSINLGGVLGPLLNLSANVSVTLTGNALKEHLVLIQRYPKNLYKFYNRQNPRTGAYERVPREVWSTHKPLSLLGLEGYSGTLTLGAGANATAAAVFPTMGDELGISISVSMNAAGNLTGKFIRLTERYSDSFPGPEDYFLSQHYFLERIHLPLDGVVEYLFSRPDKRLVKTEIDQWITTMVATWLQAKSVRKRKRDFVLEQIQRIPLARISDFVQNTLNDYVFSLINFELQFPVFTALLERFQGYQSSQGLFERLHDLQAQIRLAPPAAIPPQEREAALRQAFLYEQLLRKCYRRVSPESLPQLQSTGQGFFSLFSFAAGASVAGEATAQASLQAPEIPVAQVAIAVSGGAGALANASVDIQHISYRYQSLLKAKSPLYFTQDAWMIYRQTKASAGAFADAQIVPLSAGWERNREVSYVSLNYKSTALYWRPRQDAAHYVFPEPGSGLRFGISVAMRRLIRYAKAKASKSDLPYVRTPICRSLNINAEQFDAFILAADLTTLQEDQEGFPKYVYLETAFQFPENFQVLIRAKAEGKQEPESKFGYPQMHDPSAWRKLESIRLRMRISDMETTEQPVIKLGFPVVSYAKFNLDLTRLKGAGQQGMFDFYVHWASNPTLNTDPAAAKTAQEFSVPPVLFLHQ